MNTATRIRFYVGALVVLAGICLAYAMATWEPITSSQIVLFVIFLVLGGLAEVYATWVPAFRMEISSSIAIYLAALFILGLPLAVLLVFLTNLFTEMLLRWDNRSDGIEGFVIPVLFNVGQLIVTATLSGLVLRFTGHELLVLGSGADYVYAVMAFSIYLIANLALVTSIISLTERRPFIYTFLRGLKEFTVQYVVLCVAALLLTVLYMISVWHVFLALFPLALVHVSFRGWVKLQTEARKTFENISKLLDERDHYTAVHSTSVAELAVCIGRTMGLSQRQIESIDVAARVHDIGKVAVPDSILLKAGPLTPEEWVEMKRHPVISAELIEGLEIYASVADAVRHEHEHWDGTGYPSGLSGEAIPLISRIICAADVYDALVTDRPYRKAFSSARAKDILCEMKGRDLDPAITDALLSYLEQEEDDAVLAVENASCAL
ncbi:HD-GYP domain-containing protein [Candidatus Bipolaricaulota bacterium]|nr:HD-GYP domain-containing protein [Candidatus Bipolaricaulota bacterium]